MQSGAKIVAPLMINILSNFHCTGGRANRVQLGANFYTMRTKIETQFEQPELKPNRHNFPDVIFPDGRVMVYDEILEIYKDAPAGYSRNDMLPFPAGDIMVMPYVDNIPTIDQLNRRKIHLRLQWIEFLSALLQITLIIVLVLAVIGAIGYLWQVIRAFGENGAPRIAELTGVAIGNILAVIMYILAGVVILFGLGSFIQHLMKSNTSGSFTASGAGDQATGGGANQNININIAGRDFSGGNDPAQKIIN